MEIEDGEIIMEQIPHLTRAIQAANCPVVLVSNEVGTGIVPQNKLARQFRDLVGTVNQTVADQADRVIWMVAGIPVTIKGT
jgi:adenosylcobinamide kinase/adenosylcobinamide-phosphate guanylyltransferase